MKKSDQISTGITSRYCKWFLHFNLSVLINKNSSFRLVQHLHWELLVTLSHLMQMKSVKITFLQSIMEHLCVLELVQISFWPQSYILLPPDCWTLHVLKHSKGPNSAWMLRCLFLSIFPSSLRIHSGRMGTEILSAVVTSSKRSERASLPSHDIYLSKYNQPIQCSFVTFKFKTVVSLRFYLVSRFEIHHTATATMVKLLTKGSNSLCDTNLYKLIKEVRFPC